MKQAKGFTLIEMIVVIVVLGILAVTAIPKFMDVQSEARTAVLQGVGGAVKSANGIVYGQASIQGVEKKLDGQIKVSDSEDIQTTYGHILADADEIKKAVDTDINFYDVTDFYPNGHNEPKALNATLFTFETLNISKPSPMGYPMDSFSNDCYIVAYNDPTTTGGLIDSKPRRALLIHNEFKEC
ncbi:type II secretion system protein [Vibrio coralliirubri]|uniref:type II secretion system protein n=1 Tax=Vibrio coralliirubri TaxID=1516159 RepID=UPI000631B024|nr:type II secretion system protein [Vibrio coralliirubri]CDT13631.1 hypothetical protein VCR1J2_200555 [Vibrio coralliirubri]CDT74512.1 hypothetical protein VCR8J2_190188 [Vibrio coralliirubri]